MVVVCKTGSALSYKKADTNPLLTFVIYLKNSSFS